MLRCHGLSGKRRLLVAAIGWAVALACFWSPALVWAGDLTQTKLAQVLAKAVADKKVAIDLPQFEERDGNLFYLSWGGLRRDDANQRTPLMFPTDLQAMAIGMRRYAKANQIAELWEPHAKKIEALVQEEIDLIAKWQGTPDDLRGKLGDRQEPATKEFEAAVRDLAQHKRLGYGGPLFQGAQQWSVTLKLLPDNGTAYYMNEGDYDIYNAWTTGRGATDDKQLPWLTAGESLSMGAGYYYLYAKWPGKKASEQQRVYVSREETFTLRPKD